MLFNKNIFLLKFLFEYLFLSFLVKLRYTKRFIPELQYLDKLVQKKFERHSNFARSLSNT